jgi:hypothetical protein
MAALFCALAAASCDLPGGPGFGTGTLTLLLPETAAENAAVSRSVLSDSFTGTLVYRLTFTGPGETRSLEADGGGTTLSLDAGTWTIEALAYDPANPAAPVGSGSLTVTVSAGRNSSVRIPMTVDPAYEAGLTKIYIHSEADLRRIGTDFAIDGSFITHFYLERDIVLTRPWTAIGSGSAPFKAQFDGQGHTVTVTSFGPAIKETGDVWVYQGFFAAAENAAIKNLHVKYDLSGPVDIRTGDGSTYHDARAGGIAGNADNTVFENIRVSGNFSVVFDGTSSLGVGGIAGSLDGTITNCHVSGAIGGTSANYLPIGGIAGSSSSGTIDGSSFTGTVSGNASGDCAAGGIAGAMDGDITACFAEGHIRAEADSSYVGGIAGKNPSSTGSINKSYAAGIIESIASYISNAGGIAGSMGGSIEHCYAWANLSAGGAEVSVGGIAGVTHSTITTCYARGAVLGTNSSTGDKYAGGIAGYTDGSGAVSSCVAMNDSISFSNSIYVRGIASRKNTMSFADNYTASGLPTSYDTSWTASPGTTGLDGSTTLLSNFEGPPAGALYGSGYLDWDFAAGTGDWKFIGGYDYPVLSWQTTPPPAPALPPH